LTIRNWHLTWLISETCPEQSLTEWVPGVNIGKIFRQFSIKNADTSEQKSKFSKNFNLLSQIELRATSDEKRLYFRIKSAGSSNYRGAAFFASDKNQPNFKLVFECLSQGSILELNHLAKLSILTKLTI